MNPPNWNLCDAYSIVLICSLPQLDQAHTKVQLADTIWIDSNLNYPTKHLSIRAIRLIKKSYENVAFDEFYFMSLESKIQSFILSSK